MPTKYNPTEEAVPQITDKQLEYLLILGVEKETAEVLSKDEAQIMIQELTSRVTDKQRFILLQHGYKRDQITKMKREEATKLIGRLFHLKGK